MQSLGRLSLLSLVVAAGTQAAKPTLDHTIETPEPSEAKGRKTLPPISNTPIADAPQQLNIQWPGSILLEQGQNGTDLTFTDSYRLFNAQSPGMTYPNSPKDHGGQKCMAWYDTVNEMDRLDFIYTDNQQFKSHFELVSSRVIGGGVDFTHGGTDGRIKDVHIANNVDKETGYKPADGKWKDLYPSDHYAVASRYGVTGSATNFAILQMNILNEGCIVKSGVERIVQTILKALQEETVDAGKEALGAIITLSEVRDVPHAGDDNSLKTGEHIDALAGSSEGAEDFEAARKMQNGSSWRAYTRKFTEYIAGKLNSMDLNHHYEGSWPASTFRHVVDVGVLIRTPKATSQNARVAKVSEGADVIVELNNDEGSAMALRVSIQADENSMPYPLTVMTTHLNYKNYYIDTLEDGLKAGKTAEQLAKDIAENEKFYNGSTVTSYPENNSRYAQLEAIYMWAASRKERLPAESFVITGDFNVPSHLDYGRVDFQPPLQISLV